MRLCYASDLHLEFSPISIHNTENADVLILAGDIIVGDDIMSPSFDGRQHQIYDFFNGVCSEFKDVIYVFGNHEYYKGNFSIQMDQVKSRLSHLKNLHILEKETFTLNDITFICGTMWTDFNRDNSTAKILAGLRMNDFRVIKNDNKTFTPQDAYEDHVKFLEFAGTILKDDSLTNIVVVTHHGPSYKCVPDEFVGGTLNFAFVSELDDFIINNPKIKLWITGHNHTVKDFMIGTTRVVQNCRGYDGYESMANTFKVKYLDI